MVSENEGLFLPQNIRKHFKYVIISLLKKLKFSIKNFFSKSLTKNFIFCAVFLICHANTLRVLRDRLRISLPILSKFERNN